MAELLVLGLVKVVELANAPLVGILVVCSNRLGEVSQELWGGISVTTEVSSIVQMSGRQVILVWRIAQPFKSYTIL